jgi:hypothetical protein
MNDLQSIIDNSAAAAHQAAAEGMRPCVLFSEETAGEDVRCAPFIGDYIPYGWRAAFYGDYQDILGNEAEVSQWNCAGQYRGDLIFWVANCYPIAERGEYDETSLRRDAPALYQRACERGVTLGAAIVEAGAFQVYVRFYEKPDNRG